MILIQATRNAMADDLVVRDVADLTAVPTGKPGAVSVTRPGAGFVSLLSDSGVPIEPIADAVGPLFESRGKTDGGQN